MGLPNIEIRRAESRDSDQIWPLVQDFPFSYVPNPAPFERSLAELLDRPDTLLLVAEQDRRTVVGYLLASYHWTFLANGPVAWIEEVMVSESARRQGVGNSSCLPLRCGLRRFQLRMSPLPAAGRVTSISRPATKTRQHSSERPSSRRCVKWGSTNSGRRPYPGVQGALRCSGPVCQFRLTHPAVSVYTDRHGHRESQPESLVG
jgi:hypothetical protein